MPSLLTRILKANPRHRTRFHTEQDQFIGLRGVGEYPGLILRRLTGDFASPWMASGAVAQLDRLLAGDMHVLELGAGRSTAWYAARAGAVISLEDDAEWAQQVRDELHEAGIANCDLRTVPLDVFPREVELFPDDSFDVVVVDHHERDDVTRVDCLRAARTKVKPGGVLVLDDSDRPEYAEAAGLLRGWTERRFVGAKPKPLTAIATSLFVRPVSNGVTATR